MSAWAALAITVVVGAMTYAMRAIAIVALAGRTIPIPLERALRNVGPAVLAALAFNLAAGGEGDAAGMSWPVVLAFAATALTAWRLRSMLWSLGAGMITLWIATALVS